MLVISIVALILFFLLAFTNTRKDYRQVSTNSVQINQNRLYSMTSTLPDSVYFDQINRKEKLNNRNTKFIILLLLGALVYYGFKPYNQTLVTNKHNVFHRMDKPINDVKHP